MPEEFSEHVRFVALNRMNYRKALQIQQQRAESLLAEQDDLQTVYTVEHPRTITIGRNGSSEHILASPSDLNARGFDVLEVDRGGDVTYHGPGQLVVYPILHLGPFGNDVAKYVRNLEEMVIRALSEVGIVATRNDDYPGVWVGDGKICAVGARMKRRPSGEFVSSHGIALNVTTNLEDFKTIVPCGITDRSVTSVANELGTDASYDEWEERLYRRFAEVFDVAVERVPSDALEGSSL